ncbi:MAG: ADP-ribosylation factor-like protein [Candidatus Helarchaeota archaeon]
MPRKTAAGDLVFKIVYFGPELAGKTTSIKWLHEKEEGIQTGKLTSVKGSKEAGFFDRMMVKIGKKVSFQIWSVAGRKGHTTLRKVILEGCDGLVFVWSALKDAWEDNLVSVNELIDILKEKLMDTPIICMINKSDLPANKQVSKKQIEGVFKKANLTHVKFLETIAIRGENVKEAFTLCAKEILQNFK